MLRELRRRWIRHKAYKLIRQGLSDDTIDAPWQTRLILANLGGTAWVPYVTWIVQDRSLPMRYERYLLGKRLPAGS